jgi:Zn-dependent M28 family amino/carboxypeptidase
MAIMGNIRDRMTLYFVFIVIAFVALFIYMVYMPGSSFHGELPPLEDADREMARRLESHVMTLCREPMGRNNHKGQSLDSARSYIAGQLQAAGYAVGFEEYISSGHTFANVIAELPGTARPGEIIIVGAHYDTIVGAPGADDNASGVAAVLELAALFSNKSFPRTIRFAAFVNEEPPYFMTSGMGSFISAKQSAEKKEKIVAMISLEMLGYFKDNPGSQHYLPPLNFFYPDQGNFIAFVGNLKSRSLVAESLRLFRKHAKFPSEGIAAPALLPGVSWSDHRSYWKHGYPAIMVTDTAFYRNPYYHSPQDTPDTLDYEKMVYIVNGIQNVLTEMLNQ